MKSLEDCIGYCFKDSSLLRQALTHPSFSGTEADHYQRLEFLGDRILSFFIAEELYHKFPEEREGDLAKRLSALVCRETLATILVRSGLVEYIRADKAMMQGQNYQQSIACDVCEAIIAALYLDGGIEAARKFMMAWWGEALQQTLAPPYDPRSRLQEWSQKKYTILPCYSILVEEGTAHAPIFIVEVKIGDYRATGQANSKRLAKKYAAEKFLKEFIDGQTSSFQ